MGFPDSSTYILYYKYIYVYFKALFIYFQRQGKGGRKRWTETSVCGCLVHGPHWGPGPQPGMCPDWELKW